MVGTDRDNDDGSRHGYDADGEPARVAGETSNAATAPAHPTRLLGIVERPIIFVPLTVASPFPPFPSQLVDFAHARSTNARATVRPSILGPTHSHMHPDTACSDLYARFEAMCDEAERDGFADRDFRPYVPPRGPGTEPPRPPAKSIEVDAQFDARVQQGDQRGRRGKAVWSDKSAPPKKGPLRCLFDDYAARDDVHDLDDSNDKPSLMSRAEAFTLANDFDIVPTLLRRRDVAMAFANADRPAYGDEAADNRENQLDFNEFVSFICQMAILAWHRPRGAHEKPTDNTGKGKPVEDVAGRGASLDDARAVDAMLKKLDCDKSDVTVLKRRLAVYARRQIYNPRDLDAYPRYDKYAHVDAVSSARPHHAAISRVSSGAPVPDDMVERAARRDSQPVDAPRWTHFRTAAIDAGTLVPGVTRRFRITVKNRNLQGSVGVHVECTGCPAAEVRFTEGVLAPGMSKCVEVVAGSDTAGEWLGCVVITAKPLATRVYLMAHKAAMRRTTKTVGDWDEDDDFREGESHPRLDESEDDDHDAHDAAIGERLGRHVVRVPIYLNVVGEHRELVKRGGATVGFREHVTRKCTVSSFATIRAKRDDPEIHSSFRADPGGDASAAEALAMPKPVMRSVQGYPTYNKLAVLPPETRDDATALYPDFLKPIMASVLTARTNKAGNKIVPDARKAFGSPTDAVTDAEVASRFAIAASRVRSDGGGAEARRTLDASGYRLSSRGLSY